jgi:hypothetical protein
MHLINDDTGEELTLDSEPENLIPRRIRIVDVNESKHIGLELLSLLNKIYKRWLVLNIPRSVDPTILITVSHSIKQIDLLNIGMLGIFKARFHKVTFVFDFELNPAENSLDFDNPSTEVYYKLLHYTATSNLFSKIDLYSLKIPKYKIPLNYNNNALLRKETWFPVPEVYLPIMFLNKTLYNSVFEEPLSLLLESHLPENFKFEDSGQNYSDKIFQSIRRAVVNKLNFSHNNLSALYYYKFLSKYNLLHAEVLSSLLYKQNKQLFPKTILERVKPWNWREVDSIDYISKAKQRLDNLINKPAVFIQLLSIIAINQLEKATKSPKKSQVLEALDFSIKIAEDIFAGLRELSRNMVEHSGNNFGLLLGRVFTREDLESMKKAELPQLTEYMGELKLAKIFVDLNLLDIGDKGIIKTLPETIQLKLERKDLTAKARSQIIEDLKKLQTKEISLGEILTPKFNYLNHQSTRAISSVGLQIFSGKVNSYKGYFFVSTPANDSPIMLSHYHSTGRESKSTPIYEAGTLYNVIFPLEKLDTNRFYLNENEDADEFSRPGKEFHHLLEYSYGKEINASFGQINDTPTQLVQFNIEPTGEDNKYLSEYLMVQPLIEAIDNRKTIEKKIIPVLDCSSLSNPSTLYRVLSTLQFLHNFHDLCCINIRSDLFKELYEIIRLTGIEGKFWDNNRLILFYIDTVSKNGVHLKVPAIITAKEHQDNEAINQLCARNQAYYYSFENIESPIENRPSYTPDSKLVSRLFSINNIDLLIKVNGQTIFERNVSAILDSPVISTQHE